MTSPTGLRAIRMTRRRLGVSAIVIAAAAGIAYGVASVVSPPAKPRPMLRILGQSVAVSAAGRFSVRLRCGGAVCRGTLVLASAVPRVGKRGKARTVVVAKLPFSASPGTAVATAGQLNATGRRLLARARGRLSAQVVGVLVGRPRYSPSRTVMLVGAASARAATLPAQGLYDECAPSLDPQGCTGRLQQMASAGFSVVLNYTAWYASAAQVTAYADAAQSLGMKVIWPLNAAAWRASPSATDLLTTYPLLAASCGCTDNAGFLQYVINLVAGLPATWGYYIADEPHSTDLQAISALATQVKTLDPAHPTLAIGAGSPTPSADVDPFLPGIDEAGEDIYPVGALEPLSTVGTVSHAISALAASTHKQAVMVVQAFSYAQYPNELVTTYAQWPTEADMLAMRNAAIQQGDPQLLLWYSFYDVMRSTDPTQNWNDLRAAAFAPLPAP